MRHQLVHLFSTELVYLYGIRLGYLYVADPGGPQPGCAVRLQSVCVVRLQSVCADAATPLEILRLGPDVPFTFALCFRGIPYVVV